MHNESGTGSYGGQPLITLDEEMVFQFKSDFLVIDLPSLVLLPLSCVSCKVKKNIYVKLVLCERAISSIATIIQHSNKSIC